MDASSHTPIDETSIRYDGWRIVLVCFLLATFGWGLGFYGQSVYVAELHRLRGWPASLISGGTTFFYLFGAALVAFVSEAIKGFGPRNCLIAGTFAMAAASVAINWVFDFTYPSGRTARIDEVALQEWRGDRIFRERFFYDPPKKA